MVSHGLSIDLLGTWKPAKTQRELESIFGTWQEPCSKCGSAILAVDQFGELFCPFCDPPKAPAREDLRIILVDLGDGLPVAWRIAPDGRHWWFRHPDGTWQLWRVERNGALVRVDTPT